MCGFIQILCIWNSDMLQMLFVLAQKTCTCLKFNVFHTILLFALIQRSGTCDVYNGLCVSEGRYITHVSVKDPHLNLKNSHDSICLMFNPVVFPQTNDLQTGVNIGRLLFPLSEFVM